MNLLFSVFFVGISVLGGGCLVYKSYNPKELILPSSKKSITKSHNPLEIKSEPTIKLDIKEPQAVS